MSTLLQPLEPAQPGTQIHTPSLSRKHYLELEQGAPLFLEGDTADTFFLVHGGALTEYRSLSDGRRQVVAIYYPGDHIGITSGDRYEFTAEAACQTVVEPISRALFRSRLATDPELVNRVITQFVDRLNNSQAHLVLLGRMNAIERVSSFVLRLKLRADQLGDQENSAFVHIPMSRADMADYLGLTVETVSRCLSLLKWKKVIALSQPQLVEILDDQALSEIAYARNGLGDWIYHA